MEDYSQSSSRTRQIQNVWNICYGARDCGGVFFLFFFLNRCGFKFGNNGNYISLFFISIFSLLLYLLLSSSQSPLSLSYFIFFFLLHLNLLSIFSLSPSLYSSLFFISIFSLLHLSSPSFLFFSFFSLLCLSLLSLFIFSLPIHCLAQQFLILFHQFIYVLCLCDPPPLPGTS